MDKDDSKKSVSGEIKEVSLFPVLTSLLKPSADYLGEQFRDYLKTKIDQLKDEKRSKNLHDHISRVLSESQDEPPTVETSSEAMRQLDLFQEWSDGAQDVDSEEEILSKFWEDTLKAILCGKVRSKLLIDKLKLLDDYAATVLLKFKVDPRYRPKGTKETYYCQKLREIELLDHSSMREITVTLAIVLLIMPLGFRLYATASTLSNINESFKMITDILPYGALFIFGTLLSIWVAHKSLTEWRLTWIGEELVSYAKTSDSISNNDNQESL